MVHLENLGLVHGHLMPSNILLTEQLRAKVASPRGPAHHAQLRYSAPESILAVKMKSQFFANIIILEFLYQQVGRLGLCSMCIRHNAAMRKITL